MEDDEDCYGFGALSDLFDARAASSSSVAAPKRLDVAALSRFWWSERRLGEFRRQRHAKEYHHVAAKFDGTRVDGGLGSAFLVPRSRSESTGRVEDGGVLWVQAQASDSNAQARRKKEFQDITNRHDALQTPKGSTKSTSTVFLSMAEILDAKETRVQNTVQGITFTLRSGPQFEIAFMPGPYYDARNRDELLEAFNRQQVDDVFSPESSPQLVRTGNLLPPSRATSQSSSPARSNSSSSPNPTPQQSPSVVARTSRTTDAITVDQTALRETNRSLIRRYVQIDKGSAEAIAIAQKIHAATQYHVGPLASRVPDFSTDSTYRKQMCVALDMKMKRLNHNWGVSEQQRELRTRARCGKAGNDTLQYTDTITHQPIPPTSYEERYKEFVKAEQPEAHPVMRMFEPRQLPIEHLSQVPSPRIQERAQRSESSASSRSVVSATSETGPCILFGLDLKQSSLIDSSLLSDWETMPCPTVDDISEWRDVLDDAILATARTTFTTRISEMIQRIPHQSSASLPSIPTDLNSHSHQRSTNRRRSIDQPNLEDVRFQFDESSRPSTSNSNSPNSSKRRRSDGDASPTASRRRRRQSLVGTLDTSLLEEEKSHEAASLAINEIQAMDTICPLCCDADAVVVMKPCGHSVCRACWGRLIRVQNSSPSKGEDVRQCPWDRESVVEKR